MKEKRRHPRTDTHFPVYFICTDHDGNEMIQDLAVVLNTSENGLLIENPHNLSNTHGIKIISSSKDDASIEVKGKVVYSITVSQEKFKTGISFKDTPDKILKFTKNLTDMVECQTLPNSALNE